ncbi:MAG: LysR family transcriptional regulator [Gemmobacter sp.]|nr:LysR family transcriptional regulator [Gemmobacter sp.]
MPRNLDLTALRAFVAVADAGGVTRAAGLLNLTQSAVSMQLKRLEDSLGTGLFLRTARRLSLTAEGEQLLGLARRMLALNDEALARLGAVAAVAPLRLGVTCDIVYPEIPPILKRLAACHPQLRVNLTSGFTVELLDGFARGAFDAILTTEDRPGPGGEELSAQRLVWIGAAEGHAWTRRPLQLAFKDSCIFRPAAHAALEQAGLDWEQTIDGESEQAAEAMVGADLAITARLRGRLPPGCAEVTGQGLPALGGFSICLYAAPTLKDQMAQALLSELRLAYRA